MTITFKQAIGANEALRTGVQQDAHLHPLHHNS